MADLGWIEIPRWRDFQHYDPAKRTPPWVKTYTRLMSDGAYLDLTGDQRAILHGLWLEYASSSCRLRAETRSLTRRLNLRVTRAQLERLEEAGFIRLSASTMLAKRLQTASDSRAGVETETEIEASQVESVVRPHDTDSDPDSEESDTEHKPPEHDWDRFEPLEGDADGAQPLDPAGELARLQGQWKSA